jgi:hypothetical protein
VPNFSQLGLTGVRAESISSAKSQGGSSEGISGLKVLGVHDLSIAKPFDLINTSVASFHDGNNLPDTQETFLATLSGIDDLKSMIYSERLYQNLYRNIAPNIWNREIIRKVSCSDVVWCS